MPPYSTPRIDTDPAVSRRYRNLSGVKLLDRHLEWLDLQLSWHGSKCFYLPEDAPELRLVSEPVQR